MSVQNLPDHVLQELTHKRNDLFLAGLRHTLIDVELVALIMDLGMLAVHEEIERRRQEQLRASHIDEVLQTVTETVTAPVSSEVTENGLRAVIERMADVAKEMREERLVSEELDTQPQAAVPAVMNFWDRPQITDLGAMDLPDEPF